MSAHRYEIKDAGPDVLIDGADISMRCNSTIRNALRQQLSDIAALTQPLKMAATKYEPYSKETSSTTDRVAWALCQIIDDDAPMRWARYRFAAKCIASNAELMDALKTLGDERK